MKITHIGHAAVLVETGGIRILSDPWWKGPCFGAQWWIYPKPHLEPVTAEPVDFIYVSHSHHDHFHPGTLKSLPKTARVLVSSTLGIAVAIRELGFEVIEIGPDEEKPLDAAARVRVRIIPTHGDDSLMAIDDGERVALNINDALHSAPHDVQQRHVAALKALYPKIDYALCGYGIASHFPNCYVIPGKDPEATAIQRQRYFNRQWARLMHELNPRYALPFAADVVFLEDALFWSNAPLHNGERPTTALQAEYPGTTIRCIDIAPGFAIEDDHIVADIRRAALTDDGVRREMADGIRRANAYGATTLASFTEVEDMLRERVDALRPALASFDLDYRLLIWFHNSDRQLVVAKQGGRVDVKTVVEPDEPSFDIVYRTRVAYLRWALGEPGGDELLFVGSGGVFEFASEAMARLNAHREFIGLVRNDLRVRERPGPARKAYIDVRSWVAGLLGRKRVDLYDLGRWTVFSNHSDQKAGS